MIMITAMEAQSIVRESAKEVAVILNNISQSIKHEALDGNSQMKFYYTPAMTVDVIERVKEHLKLHGFEIAQVKENKMDFIIKW